MGFVRCISFAARVYYIFSEFFFFSFYEMSFICQVFIGKLKSQIETLHDKVYAFKMAAMAWDISV